MALIFDLDAGFGTVNCNSTESHVTLNPDREYSVLYAEGTDPVWVKSAAGVLVDGSGQALHAPLTPGTYLPVGPGVPALYFKMADGSAKITISGAKRIGA